VVDILSVEESTGECVCLEGQLRCPPEDSDGLSEKGNMSYWRVCKGGRWRERERERAQRESVCV